VCGAPVDSGRLVPNLAVRAAAAAFQVEESLDASLRLKRAREGESARGSLPFIRVSGACILYKCSNMPNRRAHFKDHKSIPDVQRKALTADLYEA
jgi:hypothetical protein